MWARRRAPSTTTSTSKQALLTAVIDRLVDAGLEVVQQVVDDPALSAVEKLQRYFSEIGSFKAERADFVLAADEGLVLGRQRHRAREACRKLLIRRVTPQLARDHPPGRGRGLIRPR